MKKDSDFTVILLMCLMAASSVGLSTNCTGVFFTPVSIALGIKRGTLALYATISSITTEKIINHGTSIQCIFIFPPDVSLDK